MRAAAAASPRARLLGAVALVAGAVSASGWLALMAAGLAVGAAWRIHSVPAAHLRGLAKGLWWLLLLAFVFEAHRPIERLALPEATSGLWSGAFVAARLLLGVAAASWAGFGVPAMDLTQAVRALLWPLRRVGAPVGGLTVALIVAIRFFPILRDEAARIRLAQQARGGELGKGVWRRVQGSMRRAVPLLVAAIRRSERLGEALAVRGYRGGEGPAPEDAPLSAFDRWFVGACAAVALAVVLFS